MCRRRCEIFEKIVQLKNQLRYDFEQNKRNNLIFYGVPGEERENRDDLR